MEKVGSPVAAGGHRGRVFVSDQPPDDTRKYAPETVKPSHRPQTPSPRRERGELLMVADPQIDYTDEFEPPQNATEVPRWLMWKYTDTRKIPRAPWRHTDWPDKFVSAHDPDNWLDYETFSEMRRMYPGFEPAFSIPPREEDRDYELEGDAARLTDVLLFDFDDVINSDGEVHPRISHYIEHIDSYAQISTSKTGIHILVEGRLPPGVRTITGDISSEQWPDAEIEIYSAGRYIAMTGWHIEGSPDTIEPVDDIVIDHFLEEFDVNSEDTGSNDRETKYSPDELEEIDTTSDIEAVYDAIDQMQFRAERLKSQITRDRGGGYLDMDPSWADSESGTRLACVDDTEGKFYYRAGGIGMSLFQVVAREEGIIRHESEYPEGEAFWEAVDACRDRGWDIPEFVPDDVPEKYAEVDQEAIERPSTTSMKVFSAGMHHATVDDVYFQTDHFEPVGRRMLRDPDSGELVRLINAVAYDEGIIDEPTAEIEDRVDWIKTGHTMRFRGATVPEYKRNGGASGGNTPRGWK